MILKPIIFKPKNLNFSIHVKISNHTNQTMIKCDPKQMLTRVGHKWDAQAIFARNLSSWPSDRLKPVCLLH